MKIALFGREIPAHYMEKLEILLNTISEFKKSEEDAGKVVEVLYYKKFYDELHKQHIALPKGNFFSDCSNLPTDTNLFLSLGGDGTLLEASTLIKNRNIPVAGVNFGRLGFLTNAYDDLNKLLNNNYSIAKRSMLHFDCNNIPANFFPYALNEITVQRKDPTMLEINVSVNGNMLPTYMADGILVATATGSTAYSLSLGGPIAFPDTNVLILSPIAPHNLNVRPLIISDFSKIEISFFGRCKNALLTADYRYFNITQNEKVTILKGDFALNCITVNNNFIAALNQKLLWGEDKRNNI